MYIIISSLTLDLEQRSEEKFKETERKIKLNNPIS